MKVNVHQLFARMLSNRKCCETEILREGLLPISCRPGPRSCRAHLFRAQLHASSLVCNGPRTPQRGSGTQSHSDSNEHLLFNCIYLWKSLRHFCHSTFLIWVKTMYACVCTCLCACVYASGPVWASAHVSMCLWKLKVSLYHRPYCFFFFFPRQGNMTDPGPHWFG